MSSEVLHDEYGIPHIWADSLGELAFAQGHEVATERAQQVELERLRSEGRTARHLGPAGLEWDRFAHRARIDEIAQRAYDGLDEETRGFVEAYVDGVNVAFRDRRWMPWTPLGVFLVQQIQFGSYPSKLWRHRLRSVLGDAGPATVSSGPLAVSGSNAFGLAGSRTATGLPLVAGDPHRTFEAPNVYLQVHLACPEFDTVGFSFPGVPGVQHFGHTGSVAWALTNAMADYQDLYVEQLRRTDHGVEALGPDGWEPTEHHIEQVEVLDDEPEEVEVVITARGPVILGGPDEPEALSLATPSYRLGDLGMGALLGLLRARTVADVEDALEHWVEPVNNWVVADRDGTVHHRVRGRVPERDVANRIAPVPAWEARHAWTGWVTDLPGSDPGDAGRVVTANERGSAAYDRISSHFAASWRADRIADLLDEGEAWSSATAMEVLLDARQLGGDALLDAVAALPETDPATGEATREVADVQARLATWDREMSADSTGAALFSAVRDALTARICAAQPLAGLRDGSTYGPLHEPWLWLPLRVGQALPTLLGRGEDIGLDVPALLRDAVVEVARTDVGTWGDRHGYAPLSGFAQFGLDDDPVDVAGAALPGDMDCVAAMGWLPGTTRSVRGPVARYVWDLADREQSRWAVPMGASGRPDSPHHTDQFQPWLDGTLVPVSTDWARLRALAAAGVEGAVERDPGLREAAEQAPADLTDSPLAAALAADLLPESTESTGGDAAPSDEAPS